MSRRVVIVVSIIVGTLIVYKIYNSTYSFPKRVTFSKHIRPLFREYDVASMKRLGLNLSDYDDVKKNAQEIYDRVSKGSMPCDGGWSNYNVQLFEKWINQNYLK